MKGPGKAPPRGGKPGGRPFGKPAGKPHGRPAGKPGAPADRAGPSGRAGGGAPERGRAPVRDADRPAGGDRAGSGDRGGKERAGGNDRGGNDRGGNDRGGNDRGGNDRGGNDRGRAGDRGERGERAGPSGRAGSGDRGGDRAGRRGPPGAGERERPEKPSPFSLQSFTVEGLAAVSEYLRFRPAAVTEVRSTPKLKADVERLVRDAGLDLSVGERQSADEDAAPVTARVALKALEQDAFLSRLGGRAKDVLLAVDHITDPRNLGAIVRSAAFFGVREVVAPERRQVLLTQSAVHTAQGGFALADLVCVTNLSRTLKGLKDLGYWILGTAMDGEPYTKLPGEYDKVVLVLGSEESGLSRNVRELCDRLVAIPGRGPGLESLNVSVAAGIVLSEFTRDLPPASA